MTTIYGPANTFGLPTAIAEPHAIGSPIRESSNPFTNTVELPAARELAWHDGPQQ